MTDHLYAPALVAAWVLVALLLASATDAVSRLARRVRVARDVRALLCPACGRCPEHCRCSTHQTDPHRADLRARTASARWACGGAPAAGSTGGAAWTRG